VAAKVDKKLISARKLKKIFLFFRAFKNKIFKSQIETFRLYCLLCLVLTLTMATFAGY